MNRGVFILYQCTLWFVCKTNAFIQIANSELLSLAPRHRFITCTIDSIKHFYLFLFKHSKLKHGVIQRPSPLRKCGQTGCQGQGRKKKKGERDMLSWTIKSSKETLSFYFSLSHTLSTLHFSVYLFLRLSPWHWPVYIIDAKYMRLNCPRCIQKESAWSCWWMVHTSL